MLDVFKFDDGTVRGGWMYFDRLFFKRRFKSRESMERFYGAYSEDSKKTIKRAIHVYIFENHLTGKNCFPCWKPY